MAIITMFKNFIKKTMQTNLKFKRDLLWIKRFLLMLRKRSKQGLRSQITVMLMAMSLKTSIKSN